MQCYAPQQQCYAPPRQREASPVRREASPVRREASPVQRQAAPVLKQAPQLQAVKFLFAIWTFLGFAECINDILKLFNLNIKIDKIVKDLVKEYIKFAMEQTLKAAQEWWAYENTRFFSSLFTGPTSEEADAMNHLIPQLEPVLRRIRYVPQAGDGVIVSKNFMSNSEPSDVLSKNLRGRTIRLDEGWALIKFEGFEKRVWVRPENFRYLLVNNSDQRKYIDHKPQPVRGDRVIVLENFRSLDSDGSSPVSITRGEEGTVYTIDEDGDAQINFDGKLREQWVDESDFDKLYIYEPSREDLKYR